MRTGVACNYELVLACRVVLDKSVDIKAYAETIKKDLSETALFENAKGKIKVEPFGLSEGIQESETGGNVIFYHVCYELKTFPPLIVKADPRPYFDFTDGETVIDKMKEAITGAFDRAGYVEFLTNESFVGYDTEETLFEKLKTEAKQHPELAEQLQAERVFERRETVKEHFGIDR
jgi:hypothetical protein